MSLNNKNAYAGPHTAVAPSGHRRNPFSVILFLAVVVVVVVVVVVNKLVEPNTAVFGINTAL